MRLRASGPRFSRRSTQHQPGLRSAPVTRDCPPRAPDMLDLADKLFTGELPIAFPHHPFLVEAGRLAEVPGPGGRVRGCVRQFLGGRHRRGALGPRSDTSGRLPRQVGAREPSAAGSSSRLEHRDLSRTGTSTTVFRRRTSYEAEAAEPGLGHHRRVVAPRGRSRRRVRALPADGPGLQRGVINQRQFQGRRGCGGRSDYRFPDNDVPGTAWMLTIGGEVFELFHDRGEDRRRDVGCGHRRGASSSQATCSSGPSPQLRQPRRRWQRYPAATGPPRSARWTRPRTRDPPARARVCRSPVRLARAPGR